LSYTFIFHKQFYFVVSGLKIIGHGNPDNNLESPCTSLAKGGTSRKRPSPHLHKVLTPNSKVSPRTFQTALVHDEGLRDAYSSRGIVTIVTSTMDWICGYNRADEVKGKVVPVLN
jgi:hypothetical protein